MPELPEVESARVVIERHGLRRRIVDVDDCDTFVCRPHAPGEIRHALLDSELISAMRRGKSMWFPSSETVTLGIHLGMSGKIVIADADGTEIDGGDYWEGGRKPGDYRWARFTLTFEDGGRLMLVDPRRLGRIRLNPPVEELGPDAQWITPAQFRTALASSTAPVKARLMDQRKIAGIGNLLADEILWRARIHPARDASSLTSPEQSRLLRASRDAIRAALRDGGVHTLEIIPYRRSGSSCPRDHAPMTTGKVDGRTSWWCSAEQLLVPRLLVHLLGHGPEPFRGFGVERVGGDPGGVSAGSGRVVRSIFLAVFEVPPRHAVEAGRGCHVHAGGCALGE
jgi:formamidopyrimidine-DNA glycosylase